MNMNEWLAIGTLVATLSALLSALAALDTARAARKAISMQILLDFSKRNADPDMGTATKLLWDFKSSCPDGDGIRIRFDELKKENFAKWNEIDDARRIVHKFYIQLMQAKQAGLFSEREIIIGVYKHQFETVVKILRHLEDAKVGRNYTRPIFKEYQRLFDNYERLFKKYLGESPG